MRKPVIGMCFTANKKGDLASRFVFNSSYVNAIYEAGGVPMLIPVTGDSVELAKDYMAVMDGLLVPGGVDCSTRLFGQEPHPTVKHTNVELDNFEIELVRLAKEAGKPILGICRGLQLINIAFGGTLTQDIPSQLKSPICHGQDMLRRDELTHSVDPVEGSKYAALLGSEKHYVNSFHHQCIDRVADGFKVGAKAPDGIVEGIESEEFNTFAVQYHPEELFARYDEFRAIFKDEVERAKKYIAEHE